MYAPALLAPPHLMDDVDAVQAQIARNMLESGDWVTARLDGVPYLEKAPLKYWMIACSYAVFGVHDWAARLPVLLSVLALVALVYFMGCWAFGEEAGFFASLVLGTCVGTFLFTRILIPDITLTLTIALALWALLRALDEEERRPRLWAAVFWLAMAAGVLLKGLIGVVFPCAAAFLWLAWQRRLLDAAVWKRMHPVSGLVLFLLVAAPWHILATLRNPPYFDFSMTAGPGQYRGFFWFYFFNEHILRFLNRRWPRDYNTVPRHLFWLLHLVWFFPWSAYLPTALRLRAALHGRARNVLRMLACWAGFVMIFFTFSTTQEYYSMPAYPAFALLLGLGIAEGRERVARWARLLSMVCAAAGIAAASILAYVWRMPAPGDISRSLTQNPELYTLSLGHMGDLTLASFAYLKLPLGLAAAAFLAGAAACWRFRPRITHLGAALMMVLFLNAARIAMQVFDPYLSSHAIAERLKQGPKGTVIFGDQYYVFSSVFFYADLDMALLWRGRYHNLEYGSYAPGAPDVFLDDHELRAEWEKPQLAWLIAEGPKLAVIEELLGRENVHRVFESGGKWLLANRRIE
ncbi:MAG: glycosyltransferase family 39 protein [Bryobacteraceae bacterium]|nr:glycosyltransferase family 39 protein [Bryobacteraceae bacterium]